jgi:SAM-dependent methyltransferase
MAALNALFDKRKLALTRAKLRAWWEGEAFDAEAAQAEIDAELAAAANENDDGAEEELFDAPEYELPPRLQALAMIWGEGRVRPGDATGEKLEPARLGLAAEGLMAFFGPGLEAPVRAMAEAHSGKIDVFEWREETLDALKHGVSEAKLDERVTMARIDLEACTFTPAHYDGILSVDDFAYCAYPPRLAQQFMKALKPGGCAVVECYVGLKSEALATAFAAAFAEPHVRAHGDLLQFFQDTGLAVEGDEDLTDEFLATARNAFKELGQRLSEAGSLEPAIARELAWESEAWRMRLKLLAQRRLERRRFILRRPVDGAEEEAPAQDENANAPAA